MVDDTKSPNRRPSAEEVRAKLAEIDRRYAWGSKRCGKQADGPSRPALVYVRLYDVERFLAHTYGSYLPDDDAGREDLKILGHVLAATGKPMTARLSSWAPWATEEEIDRVIGEIEARPVKWAADTLARKLGLTMAVRTELGITTIGAIDCSKEQRAELRKQRNTDKKRERRRKAGAMPREQYEAQSITKSRPWDYFQISESTWRRRGKPMPPGRAVEVAENGLTEVCPQHVYNKKDSIDTFVITVAADRRLSAVRGAPQRAPRIDQQHFHDEHHSEPRRHRKGAGRVIARASG